jgi:hypothetical protein
MAITRNPMAGRHNVGGKFAAPGSTRGGQAEPRGNRPITASTKNMTPRPGVLANQAETSLDLQRRLAPDRAPQPFTNRGGAATAPTGTVNQQRLGVPYGIAAGANAKPQSYGSPVMSEKEMFAATGDTKPRGYNAINDGFQTHGGKRQAGRPGNKNANTSAKDNARVRQRPGGF